MTPCFSRRSPIGALHILPAPTLCLRSLEPLNCYMQIRDRGKRGCVQRAILFPQFCERGPQKDSVASGTVKHAPLGPASAHSFRWAPPAPRTGRRNRLFPCTKHFLCPSTPVSIAQRFPCTRPRMTRVYFVETNNRPRRDVDQTSRKGKECQKPMHPPTKYVYVQQKRRDTSRHTHTP